MTHHTAWMTIVLLFMATIDGHSQVRRLGGRGPIGVAQPDIAATPEATLPLVDRELSRALRQAKQLVEAKRYVDAAEYLQMILDFPEDGFMSVDDTESSFRSLKAEADRIVAEMPEGGRNAYRLQFEPKAAAALADARKNGKRSDFVDVIRRYSQTQSGQDAIYELGSQLFDQGNFLAAAHSFERLRKSADAGGREPMLSLKCAMSWKLGGRETEAKNVLAELAKRDQELTVDLAGGEVELVTNRDAMTEWLAGVELQDSSKPLDPSNEWTSHAGGIRRNAVVATGADHPASEWTAIPTDVPRRSDSEISFDQTIQSMVTVSTKNQRPREFSIQTREPLIVGDLVLVRTPSDVTALDRHTGEFRWRGMPDLFIDRLHHSGAQGNQSVESQLQTRVVKHVWIDVTYGRMSTDGKYVYCVELPDHFPEPLQQNRQPNANSNLLLALRIDDEEGPCEWRVGGERNVGPFELPLAGHFFLGPPTPLGGELFCLADVDNETRLLVLEPSSGEVKWSQGLAATGDYAREARRNSGLVVAAADGVVVCPTGAGSFVAIDLTTRSLLWAYSVRPNQQNLQFQRRRIVPTPNMVQSWLDEQPVIVDGRVLLKSRHTNELHCVDLRSGRKLWTNSEKLRRYIVGVAGETIVVADDFDISAYSLEDGKLRWKEQTGLSHSTGRGLIVNDRVLIPRWSDLVHLSLQTGEVLERETFPNEAALGNLAAAGNTLIVQGLHHVYSRSLVDD
ncbi:outer membrane protein assembly factor BamB family protein [Thalassoroseus pseudoceratinae]|uniref:outer membrane protein assembly factor BamB family protein n=1 Tax=Thalassoroseus pseudoceratinae TaxID=2713176 RepID=UPI0014225A48|nr:PQQ-binding-like beta-propeller repeat protein [Thalassoroseus pseudoceratinae]